jgi:hypothetical protein
MTAAFLEEATEDAASTERVRPGYGHALPTVTRRQTKQAGLDELAVRWRRAPGGSRPSPAPPRTQAPLGADRPACAHRGNVRR